MNYQCQKIVVSEILSEQTMLGLLYVSKKEY